MSKGRNERRRSAQAARHNAESRAEFDDARFAFEEERVLRRSALPPLTTERNDSKTKTDGRGRPLNVVIGVGLFAFGGGLISNNIANDPRTGYLALLIFCVGTICLTWPKGRSWRAIGISACVGWYFFAHTLVEYKFRLSDKAEQEQKSVIAAQRSNDVIVISNQATEIAFLTNQRGMLQLLVDNVQRTNQILTAEKATTEQLMKFYSHVAHARQWQPPELPKGAIDPSGKAIVRLKIGGSVQDWPIGSEAFESQPNTPAGIVFPGGRLAIPYIENNRVYIKTQAMFGNPERTIKMNNEWLTNIPPAWDCNFNENSFELVDAATLPVLQIRYDSADTIEVNGVFVATNGAVTIAFDDGVESVHAIPGIPLPHIPAQKAWFKYPSTNFPGELVK